MKTRNGFVSNSSSASYIVKIQDITLEEFANQFRSEYCYGEYSLDDIKKNIEEHIAKTKEDQLKYGDTLSNAAKYYGSILQRYEDFLKELAAIEPSDSVAVMSFLFNYYGVKFEETKHGLTLSYFTSMHNDFNEGNNRCT